MPELSVVIPTLNRDVLFHDTVRHVLGQRWRDLELWIVDQSDAPGRASNERFVAEIGDDRVRYLHLDVKGLPNARNEGLARATGRIVLFLDDDILLIHDGFLDAHLRAYDDPTVGGATGRIIERSVRANAPTTTSRISFGGRVLTNQWGTERTDIDACKGANMSYRMDVVRQVGGFDRRYTGTALLEDTDYGYRVRRAGWRLVYEPAAELVHLSALSGGVRVEDALLTEYWRFRSSAYFALKHRGPAGFAPFTVTFGGIALKRAAQWKRPAAVARLSEAIRDGMAAWRAGPDEDIPWSS